MKIAPAPHSWRVTPAEAAAIQRELAGKVRRRGPRGPFQRVAGLDAAFSRDRRFCIAAAVVWDCTTREVVETGTARRRLEFPYVPGLLSFREAPSLLAALGKLQAVPDALICDGHGLAHPRRFGIACHVGLLTGLPTLGCAKSRLVGRHRDPGPRRGARSRLLVEGETLGSVLRTRDGVRPVFVSVGHRIDLSCAVATVLRCSIGYRLPEPTRLADRLVARKKGDPRWC